MENQTVTFKQGKESRNQLELPTLHFIVMDQWIDVIGDKALLAWLKMYTWCDRSSQKENNQVNLWEQAKIPTSYNKVIKKLGVGRDTFYNKILKPLWNVGLIDIEEYGESEANGNKPMNIIVYKYPQNNKALAFEKLTLIRNYDEDYHSQAKTFANQGGRPKKEDGSEIEPPMVPDQNHPPFSNRTRDGSEIGHNNIFNLLNNTLNPLNNNLNNFINTFNNLEEEEKEKVINSLVEKNVTYQVLEETLSEKGISPNTIKNTVLECYKRGLLLFTIEDLNYQLSRMARMKDMGERIFDFATYFANGLLELTDQTKLNKNFHEENKKQSIPQQSYQSYNWVEEN